MHRSGAFALHREASHEGCEFIKEDQSCEEGLYESSRAVTQVDGLPRAPSSESERFRKMTRRALVSLRVLIIYNIATGEIGAESCPPCLELKN